MEYQSNSGMYDQEKIFRIESSTTSSWDEENILRIESSTTWTREEDKLFESALVHVPEDIPGRWDVIAKAVPGKTAEQVRAHYEVLLHDLNEIEAGHVEIPRYADDYANQFASSDSELRRTPINLPAAGKCERKKGTPWTRDEHRNFLTGLTLYGRGDWRSISRNSVVTRTPTQVASHAQKYFLRQNSARKERKRASIHDITIADTMTVVEPPPPTILYGGQDGSGGGGGTPPQMGYEYQ